MNRKPGDWNCPSCQHLNFSRRDTCQRCSEGRPVGIAGGEYGGYGGRNGGGASGFGTGYGSGGGAGDYGRNYGGSFGFGGNTEMAVRPGDWYCTAGGCGAHNFASRSTCYKCRAYKEESGGILGMPSQGGYEEVGRGSRGGYGFGSGHAGGSGGRQGWKAGDWICGRSDCNEHNFASRSECYRCSAPRDTGVNV